MGGSRVNVCNRIVRIEWKVINKDIFKKAKRKNSTKIEIEESKFPVSYSEVMGWRWLDEKWYSVIIHKTLLPKSMMPKENKEIYLWYEVPFQVKDQKNGNHFVKSGHMLLLKLWTILSFYWQKIGLVMMKPFFKMIINIATKQGVLKLFFQQRHLNSKT